MAAWTLCRALDCLDRLPASRRMELRKRLRLVDGEIAEWDAISRRLRIAFHDGVISQFEGFDSLRVLDPARLGDRAAGRRIDWVLDAQGDTINAYQVVKQDDTLMLLHLLGERGLIAMLDRLGYWLTRDDLAHTANYYLARTSHDSCLSRIVRAGALAQIDPKTSWRLFEESLRPELNPANRASSRQGVHLGAMAATIDVLQRQFLGLCFGPGGIRLEPALPAALGRIRLIFQYRDGMFELEAARHRLCVGAASSNPVPVTIWHGEDAKQLAPGSE